MQFPLTFPITFDGEVAVLTDGTNNVIFDVVKEVIPTVVKDVQIQETTSGTVVLDKGRSSDVLRLIGTQYTNGYANMEKVNNFTGSEVELKGMVDSNHNGDYFIQNLQFNAQSGYPSNMYDFNIELQRVRD